MNNIITIKKNGKWQPYMTKQLRLVSYYSGIPSSNIKELVEEYGPYIYSFNPNK